ncbi:MAG: R3H domain-containing nucleic acid-binding protein [Candidatus Saccharimonadales bacterium]
MDKEESVAYAKKYIEDILSFFGLNTDVKVSCDDEVIELSVPSTHLNGFLIGQRGDTLRSLQQLLSTTLKNKNAFIHRVNLDIADYKRQRYDRLVEQVVVWIKQVRDTKEPYHLEPMNAAERRVVHQAVADYSDIVTLSEGEGRDRHIVLSFQETEK